MRKGIAGMMSVLTVLTTPVMAENLLGTANGYIGLEYGVVEQKGSGSEVDSGEPGYPDSYGVNSLSKRLMMGIEGGFHFTRQPKGWLADTDIGVELQKSGSGVVSGDIRQYSLARYQNYSYSYTTESRSLIGIVREGLYRWNIDDKSVEPFIEAGIGCWQSTASAYEETPYAGVEPRRSPGFSEQTLTEMGYKVGMGIRGSIGRRWFGSLAYDLESRRKASLGGAEEYGSGPEIKIGTHLIVMGVGYRFE